MKYSHLAALASCVVASTTASHGAVDHVSVQQREAAARRFQHLSQVLRDTNSTTPQQIMLSLTVDMSEMQVTFVTNDTACAGYVLYGAGQQQRVQTLRSTYTAGITGWSGTIHAAVMTGLAPGSSVSYQCCCTPPGGAPSTCAPGETYAQPAQPSGDGTLYAAVNADMGTVQLFGYLVADELVKEHTTSGRPFELVLLAGDVSYATVDPPKDEIEGFWDLFGVQASEWARTAPFMPTVGNHEHVPGMFTNLSSPSPVATPSDYAAFSARYPLAPSSGPAGGNASFWYTFAQGPVQFISTSSEHPVEPGTPQYVWIDAQLSSVDRSVTPWVIFLIHRPILSSSTQEEGDHLPGSDRLNALEPLFRKYGNVDVVIQGHLHCYERMHPNWNGSVTSTPTPDGNGTAVYTNPGAPLYLVAATSGAIQDGGWISPTPAWSAYQQVGTYGFGRLEVVAGHTLTYTYVDTNGKTQDEWRIVKSG